MACLCYGIQPATQYPRRTLVSTATISTVATTIIGFDFISYLQHEGQEFCSSFLTFMPSTMTVTSTSIRIETKTVSTTIITSISTIIATTTLTSTKVSSAQVWRRAVQTPVSVQGRDSFEISSWCSSVATGYVQSSVGKLRCCEKYINLCPQTTTTKIQYISTLTSVATETSRIPVTLRVSTIVSRVMILLVLTNTYTAYY